MADRREQILARLEVIYKAIPGVTLAARGLLMPDDTQRPAISLLDADEAAAQTTQQPGARTRPGPVMMAMTPETYVLVQGNSAEVGAALNALRALILPAVLVDATLNSLVGPNGGISYDGCSIGLGRGRNIEADMGLNFTFTYPLQLSDL